MVADDPRDGAVNRRGRPPGALLSWRLVAILALALAVRLVMVATMSSDGYPDYQDLVYHAHAIMDGRYPDRNVEGIYSFRAPLYPAVLAGVFSLAGERYRVVTALQALAGVLIVYLVYRLARTTARQRGALVAASVAAVYPYLVQPVGYLQTETLYTLLTVAATFWMLRAVGEGGVAWRPAAAAGLLGGLATLCRPSGQLLLGILAGWLIGVALARRWPWRAALPALAALVGVAALVVLPWTVRNYVRFSELIIVNNQAGEVFWLGNNPHYARLMHARTSTEFAARVQDMWQAIQAGASDIEDLTPAQLDRYYWRRALAYVAESPGAWGRLLVVKAVEFWRPWLHPVAYGWRVAVVSGLFAVPVFALGALGALALWRSGRRAEVALVAAMVLVHAAFFTLFHPTVRYRTPAVDVYLIALMGAGWMAMRDRWSPGSV